MHSKEGFLTLLHKYTSDQITAEEQDELFLLIASGEYDHLLEEDIALRYSDDALPTGGLDPEKAARIREHVVHAERHTAHILPGIFRRKQIRRWSAAAAVIGLLIMSGYFFSGVRRHAGPSLPTARQSGDKLLQKGNLSNRPVKFQMEDGSTIILSPAAVIHYPAHFSAAGREVYLEGDAFFDIAKDPERPFFVYNKHVVTHVLGTSFYIRTDQVRRQLEISVISGKVQVYEDKNRNMSADGKKSNGLILVPNHKVIYREEDRQFTEALVSEPMPLAATATDQPVRPEKFIFEEAPLRQVLSSLEKAYGIEIIVERESLYNCLFTGDISQQSLYPKLDLICQSVKASYEIAGTKILIKGKGCN
jgi:transmembrane sensor